MMGAKAENAGRVEGVGVNAVPTLAVRKCREKNRFELVKTHVRRQYIHFIVKNFL